jgi:hypothetical protein
LKFDSPSSSAAAAAAAAAAGVLLHLLPTAQAVAADDFKQVTRQEDLDAAIVRAAAADRLLLLMAGATWCSASRAIVQQIKVNKFMVIRVQLSKVVRCLSDQGGSFCCTCYQLGCQYEVLDVNRSTWCTSATK